MYIWGARDRDGDAVLMLRKPVIDATGVWDNEDYEQNSIEMSPKTLGLKKGECAKFNLVKEEK